MRNFKNQLAGQIGESLVVAELGRRGTVATAFAGNVPDIDILAYREGHTIHLQVKSVRKGSVSFDANRFLQINFDGDKQTVVGKSPTLDEEIIFIFVSIGDTIGEDRFFILSQSDLQGIINDNYIAWLNKHGSIRPKNAQSTHVSLSVAQIEKFKGNWELIENRLLGIGCRSEQNLPAKNSGY